MDPHDPLNMTSGMQELIFVYNANAGLLNVLRDAVHCVVSPSTYPCRLCALTYSLEGMRKNWRRFVERLEIPARFLHKDELMAEFGIDDVLLPAVFLRIGDSIRELITADEINACRTLEDLKRSVEEALW